MLCCVYSAATGGMFAFNVEDVWHLMLFNHTHTHKLAARTRSPHIIYTYTLLA